MTRPTRALPARASAGTGAGHQGRSVAVIGSTARGEATVDSDVDLLVEFEPSSSLLDLFRLEEALQDLLGTHVDVISAGALLERDAEIRRDAVPR